MSFTFTVTADRDQVGAAVADAAERYDLSSNPAEADTRDTLGKVAAIAQAAADAVGRDGDSLAVSVSGHVNPGHAPIEGWANDALTVSVSQVTH